MSKQKGQGLVEFALILPLLLLMFFGILEFGRIFQAYITVQHAAREAARYAVTGQGGVSAEERVHAIKAKALEATAGLNVDYSRIDWRECPGELYPSCLDMDAQHWPYENPGDVRSVNALLLQVYGPDGENDPGGPGERVHVRVKYNLQTLTPFFAGLFPSIQLTGQMEMINEGFGPSGASHGGVLPPPLEPLPEMGPYESETHFTDSEGTDVTQYIFGVDLIYVTVTDKDENFDLGSRDTVTVIVTDESTEDGETLTLTEIEPNAGVFRNTTGLPSTSGTPASGNGDLETGPGHTIIVRYTDDDHPGDTSSDEARMIGTGTSETYLTDSGGTPVTEYVIGEDGIYVTVEDGDEEGTGTVTVEVSATSGDLQTLTLTETDPGVFRNTAPLLSSSAAFSPEDGVLQVQHCDTITASYEDDDDPGDTSSATATMYIKSWGSVAFDREEYLINVDTIFVEVQDTDENENCMEPDVVTVRITSGRDQEELTLFETGPNTGIFGNEGLFSGPNPTGTHYNGLLEAQNGDQITVTYTDDDDATDTRDDTANMLAQDTESTISFTDSGGAEVSVYNIGVDGIYVTVKDNDENVNSGSAEQVTVRITDETGDQVLLTLEETMPNTGVFRNSTGLQSTTDTVDTGDDVLQTQGGSTITVNYTDDDDGTDTGSDTATMGTESATRFTDSGGVDAIQYAIGVEGIYVTVEDADQNTDSSLAETISVTVTDSETGDEETLTLTETGVDTGLFRNTEGLPSTSEAGSSGDGTLNTAGGSIITAVYVDDAEADTTSDTATMIGRTPSTTSFTDHLGEWLQEYYLGTQLIFVTVEDADENINPNVAETVSVTVTDAQTMDSETLTLYETGADTGVFRNRVGLASTQELSGTPDNNLLETQPDNIITARYTDDDHPGDASSATATMTESDQPPDLLVTDITVEDPNPMVGVPVSVTVTVRNQNEGSVTSTLFDIDLYIYTDSSSQPVPGRPGDAKQWYTANVLGGREIQLVYSITFPQEGTLYLYAQVDTSDRVAEADETNNIYLLEPPYVTVDVGCYVLFNDDMESGVGGWTTALGVAGTAEFERIEYGGSYVWWVDDPENGFQTYLISPEIPVPSGLANVQLRFWHHMIAETVAGTPYDGGWLEYNIDGGGWNDVTADMFASGGYNGITGDNCPSPSHEAWTKVIAWQEVVVNIPITGTTGEHTIQFRWHFEGDYALRAPDPPRGWWIDNVMVGNCQEPPLPPPPGSDDCVTVFQDNFSGTLSQWSVSNPDYVYITDGRLRLRVQNAVTSQEVARAAKDIDLGYQWAILSYSWWTHALDLGEGGQVWVSDDGGSNWTTVATYYGTNSGSVSVTLPGIYGVNLTSDFMMEFRVQADAWQGGNYERFEVDNVVLEICKTAPPPPPQTETGNIGGTTRYYDEDFGQYFYVSGVDIWATCTDCVPTQSAVYTYSLGDYTYGFWNLPIGTYDIYAESIINNDLYADLITGVQVQDGTTTTQHLVLEMLY
jgi:hypothetical protein